MRKRTRLVLVLLTVVGMLLLATFGAIGLERWRYRVARGMHMLMLASALYQYHRQYGALSPRLADIEATGLYGETPYHAPPCWWDSEASGPPVYLPFSVAPPAEGFIVAVEGTSWRVTSELGYVILGDPTRYEAGPARLAALLAVDNARRERAGEPRRWDIEAVMRR